MSPFFRVLFAFGLALAGAGLVAAERIPPAPARYFNDDAGVVSRDTADQLNARLEQFERESSNQLLVAIYPTMETDSSVEDYTVRVAESWKVGQKGRNNGAVLFAFMKEHQLYIQVGYGLEGAIPDATAKRIIEREIIPRFRAGDVNGGVTAAVSAMIAAAKGEYRGTGSTVNEQRRGRPGPAGLFAPGFAMLIFAAILLAILRRAIRGGGLVRRPTIFMNPRRMGGLPGNTWWMGGNSGGSNWGGGSSWGGGGGGFSGGGGSFGGGGAGGKW